VRVGSVLVAYWNQMPSAFFPLRVGQGVVAPRGRMHICARDSFLFSPPLVFFSDHEVVSLSFCVSFPSL